MGLCYQCAFGERNTHTVRLSSHWGHVWVLFQLHA
jgi:hypothetical protein